MLIIREVKEIVWFPSYCDFALFWDFQDQAIGWPFDDGKSHDSANKRGLKLIRTHFYDHILAIKLSTL